MKKFQNILLYTGVVVALAFSAGAFIKANAASTSSQSAPVAGQPVDLTYAAEKALPAVVHIKYLQNSKVQEVEVEQGVFPSLDAEAVRVVKSAPKWKPGIKDGKPVRVTYTLPVIFVLPE